MNAYSTLQPQCTCAVAVALPTCALYLYGRGHMGIVSAHQVALCLKDGWGLVLEVAMIATCAAHRLMLESNPAPLLAGSCTH
jgi:hypothetical protein